MRIELLNSGNQLLNIEGNNIYYIYITNHGLIMIFFMSVPILIGGISNIIIPYQLGSIDMAYSRLNNSSLLLLFPSLIILLLSSLLYKGNSVGWTMYYPLTSILVNSNITIDLLIVSIHLIGISSLVGSINLIITIICLKLNLIYKYINILVWCLLITSILLILSIPILAIAITLTLLDRNFNTTFYSNIGGSSILYQHLFWLFGHPEVNKAYLI